MTPSSVGILHVKEALLSQIAFAIGRGEVHWDFDRVKDSSLQVDCLPSIVRFVPTFAFRQLFYDAPSVVDEDCRMCTVLASEGELRMQEPAGASEWLEEFAQLFSLRHNNYPYFSGQLLMASRVHKPVLDSADIRHVLTFFRRIGFASGAMQIKGSGATIPEHAHLSVCEESLPIFRLRIKDRCSAGSVLFGSLEGYPGAIYVVRGGGETERARWICQLSETVISWGYSYNLYVAPSGAAYLALRVAEFSSAIDRKVGSVEVAGVYLGNALGAASRDLAELEEIIRVRCASVSHKRFEAALRETVAEIGVLRGLDETVMANGGRGR